MIYFAQDQTAPYLVKIGFTQDDNLLIRINGLKSENKTDMILLMTIPGERSEEIDFHFQFEEERVKGEWFLPSKRLLEFLFKHVDSDKIKLIKKSDDKPTQITKDRYAEIKKTRYKNRTLKKEVGDLYNESKRLLSENIKLETELRKYKSETKQVDL